MLKFYDKFWNSQFYERGLVYDGNKWVYFREYLDMESGKMASLHPDGWCTLCSVFTEGKFEKGTYMIHKERVYITKEDPVFYV